MHRIEVFERSDGSFGYRVYDDERLAIEQRFAPGVGGRKPMSRLEATGYATEAMIAAGMALLAAQEKAPAE